MNLPLNSDYFAGGAKLTPDQIDSLVELLNQLAFTWHHPVILGPGKYDGPPGLTPELDSKGPLSYLKFTVDTDEAYKVYKIPFGYVADTAAVHIHWTKSVDANVAGQAARWRVSYVNFDGKTMDGADGGAQTFDFDVTYDDSGVGSRIVYSTPYQHLVNITAGYYLALKVEAVTPAGTPLSEPGIVAFDLTYKAQNGLLSGVEF